MQNAKDTFYEGLRGRVAAGNAERTVVVRGVTRPGVVVEENEMVSAASPVDCFRLRWTEAKVDTQGALPAVAMTCEVLYATAGTAANGGMDRGRCLAAMDAELLAAVGAWPQVAAKQNYAGLVDGKAAVMMTTNIWWSDAALDAMKIDGDRLTRSATISVMAFEEAGEL